jgi:hypothetical protein
MQATGCWVPLRSSLHRITVLPTRNEPLRLIAMLASASYLGEGLRYARISWLVAHRDHFSSLRELIERDAFGKTATLRETLQTVVRRLSPGDHSSGDAAAEITVLRQVAERVPSAAARTEILKAVAVLRDKSGV